MGLVRPPAPGDASAAAPSEPFDEAAAYARQQAEANADNGPASAPAAKEAPAAAPAATPAPTQGTTSTQQPPHQAPPAQHAPHHGHHQGQQQAPPQAWQHHQGQQQTLPPPSGGQWANPGNPTQPVHGVPVRGPTATPHPQHVIIGYALVAPQESCSCDLRLEGWLVVLILLLTIPCIAFLPCMIPDCFQPYQVPIYGPPGSYAVPIAQPYYA